LFQFVASIDAHGRIAFLPGVRIRLKALKPKARDFEPRTIGEHLRRRRLELGLTQKHAANRVGVNPWTVLNWETGKTEPPIRSIPAIVWFLGYDPFPEPKTVGERLLQKRREWGWSVRQAADCLGVDPTTWRDWEAGELILFREHRAKVAHLLGHDPQELDGEMRVRWNVKHRRWELRESWK
jgi:transcriptional regulator with XRE-family HTH domain